MISPEARENLIYALRLRIKIGRKILMRQKDVPRYQMKVSRQMSKKTRRNPQILDENTTSDKTNQRMRPKLKYFR